MSSGVVRLIGLAIKRRGVARAAHDVCVPLTISALADRPDLVKAMWDMPNSWPEFMRHDPIGGLYYGNVETRFPQSSSSPRTIRAR